MTRRKAFANLNADGSFRGTARGITMCSRGIPNIPLAYVLTLSRPFDPDNSHVVASCRAVVTAPAERYNVAFLSDRQVAIVFVGESDFCSMPFTVTVEEFGCDATS